MPADGGSPLYLALERPSLNSLSVPLAAARFTCLAHGRLACLHRNMPLWREAGEQYLRSGGYARAVGPDMIKTVPQETLVIWGSADPILPVEDAFEFERLLPRCTAVKVVQGSLHSPQLDNPTPVAEAIGEFARQG